MKMIEAAYKVLKEENKPLKAMEITKIALGKRYIQSHGKTPEASLGRDIYMEIKRDGGNSRFVKLERGVFGLKEWGQKEIPQSTIDQEKLIEIVAKILSDVKQTRKTSFSSQELHIAYSWQGLNYKTDEIENALEFLSVVPFNILQKQVDKYSLTIDIEALLKKIGLLLQSFSKIRR